MFQPAAYQTLSNGKIRTDHEHRTGSVQKVDELEIWARRRRPFYKSSEFWTLTSPDHFILYNYINDLS